MLSRLTVRLCLAAGLCFLHSTPLFAGERISEDEKDILTLVIENDIFAGRDGNYTNGVRLAWLSAEEEMPEFIQSVADMLPLAWDGNQRISLAAGQSMFTPDELWRTEFIPNDRPYAGWLYGSLGILSDTGKKFENVQLTVGVVGPLSMAEQTQKFVHNVTSSPDPKGWDNQIQNELGVNISYERKWRGLYEFSPFGTGADITPHVSATLGNVNTDASTGLTLRLGYDLPADYGPPRIRPSLPGSDFFIPSKKFGGYLFTTVEGRAVARNIFLDGNTFRNSYDVDKEILVGSLQVGAAITNENMRLSYTHVFMTKEFKTQPKNAVFGVLTLSYRF